MLPCRILARSPGMIAAGLVRLTDGYSTALTRFLLGSPTVPEYLYLYIEYDIFLEVTLLLCSMLKNSS